MEERGNAVVNVALVDVGFVIVVVGDVDEVVGL